MPILSFCLVVTPAQFQATKVFDLAALAPLGYKEVHAGPNFVKVADLSNIPDFFVVAPEDRGLTKDGHFGFLVPDWETVYKFYKATL